MRFNPFHNIVLKLSALALALLLWVHVATNKLYEYQLVLPVKVINIPKGLILLSEPPSEVDIKLKATGKQLILLSAQDPEMFINAADYKPGVYEHDITTPQVGNALNRSYEDVEVISPKTLILKFDRLAERKLPVISSVKAEAAEGFAIVGEPKIEPETVLVSGPVSLLNRIRGIETEETRYKDLRSSIKETVSLLLPESSHFSLADSTVKISIKVEPRKPKSLSEVPASYPYHRSDSCEECLLRSGVPGRSSQRPRISNS